MSEDRNRVSLDMLKARLSSAEDDVVSALQKRVTASRHLRNALSGDGHPVAMGITAALERLTEQALTRNHDELLLRWTVEFQLDMFDLGVEQVFVSGTEPLRIFDFARQMFGHNIPMHFDTDARETLSSLIDRPESVGIMGWMAHAGAGQWWPVLNETRYHSLRIVGSWPVIGADAPYAAILSRGPLEPTRSGRSLLIAHDDHHRLQRIVQGLEFNVKELARARSLVLFELDTMIEENDPRLKEGRAAGLDGLRVVGAVRTDSLATNGNSPRG